MPMIQIYLHFYQWVGSPGLQINARLAICMLKESALGLKQTPQTLLVVILPRDNIIPGLNALRPWVLWKGKEDLYTEQPLLVHLYANPIFNLWTRCWRTIGNCLQSIFLKKERYACLTKG